MQGRFKVILSVAIFLQLVELLFVAKWMVVQVYEPGTSLNFNLDLVYSATKMSAVARPVLLLGLVQAAGLLSQCCVPDSSGAASVEQMLQLLASTQKSLFQIVQSDWV